MRLSRFAFTALLALAFHAPALATVYINRDYYWDEYSKEWRYNVVNRSYSTEAATWGTDTDFGHAGQGTPYIMEADVYVGEGATLSVEPGVTVKIPGGRGIYVAGTLNAQGTASNRITFTSASASPLPGAWDEICFSGAGASGSVMRYCDVMYGGAGSFTSKFIGYHYAYGSVRVHDSAPTIDNCSISHAAHYGVQGTGACEAKVTNSLISSCSYGLVFENSSYYQPFESTLPIRGNAITANTYAAYCSAQAAGAFDSSNSVYANSVNVCRVYGSGVQNSSTWHKMIGEPVWYLLGDIYCEAGRSLTIRPGCVVKFGGNISMFVSGTLTANGTSSERIYFTSAKNDTIGGDSNGDGVSLPAPGDWGEILLAYASSSASVLNNCVVTCGASNRYSSEMIGYHYHAGNVSCFDSSPTITNSVLANAMNCGLYLMGACSPVMTNVSLQDCGEWAVYCTGMGSNPVLSECSATGCARNVVSLPGGDLAGSRTWYKSIPYHLRSHTSIPTDASLTIQPGVAVKPAGDVGFYVHGNLQAIGTKSEPIYFTSFADDIYGDSNNNSAATTPQPGQWRELVLAGGAASASQLEQCVIRYAGNGAYNPTAIGWHYAYGNVRVQDCSAKVTDCIVSDSVHYALHVRGASEPQITGNVLAGSGYGLVTEDTSFYSTGAPLIVENVVTGNANGAWMSAQALSNLAADNEFTGNTSNTIFVYGSETQPGGANWRLMQGRPVIALHGNVTVGEGKSLTISPGNVLKLHPNVSIYSAGTIIAAGTPTDNIYFTSWKDDSLGGDSNVNGSDTTPARGDWACVFINGGDSSTQFRNCEFRYGASNLYTIAPGYGYLYHNGNCVLHNSTAVFEDSKLDLGGVYGMALLGESRPSLTRVSFADCGSYSVWQSITSNASYMDCTATNNGGDAIYLQGGSFGGERTWHKSIPYFVSGDLSAGSSAVWTLNPGSIIKVNDGVGIYCAGNMQAAGREDDPVVFTSWRDDEAGGDSNRDGSTTTPAPGAWRELMLYGSAASPSRLEHCSIRYAGNNAFMSIAFGWHNAVGNLALYDCAPVVENCEISKSGYAGLWAAWNSDAQVTNCKLHDNTSYGFYIEDAYRQPSDPVKVRSNEICSNEYAGYALPSASLSIGSDNYAHGNTRNVVRVPSGSMSVSGTWHNVSNGTCPFLVEGGVRISADVTVSVEPGTVVKLNPNCWLGISGTLNAVGTPDKRIVFTSVRDDSAGGDSNADGSASSPAPGDWREVVFASGSGDSRIEYCTLRYGGNSTFVSDFIGWHNAYGNVYLNGVSPSFDHCEFSFSGNTGVYSSGSDSAFANCTFARNAYDGLYLKGDSDPTANSCVFSHNGRHSVVQFTSEGASFAASYSDINNGYNYQAWRQDQYGNWYWAWQTSAGITGTGNFSADPAFLDPSRGIFALLPGSPCINTGDPSKTDPDGSRVDVGAHPFTGIDLSSLRSLPDGATVELVGVIVIAGASELGSMIYVESPDRTCGMRIASSAPTQVGDLITVTGTMGVVDGERAILNATVSVVSSGNPIPAPLFMAQKSLGGGQAGYNPGIPGQAGLNNLGILVAAAGSVTATGSGCFWFDDGSGLTGESGNAGVKVLSSAAVSAGQSIRVTGVSSAYLDGSSARCVIRTRSASDVIPAE